MKNVYYRTPDFVVAFARLDELIHGFVRSLSGRRLCAACNM
jgi:hypothetical protein